MDNKNKPKTDYNGVVLWFSNSLGYGFISCADFEKGVFAHYDRIINNEKFKTLSKGQHVTFEVTVTDKGPMAVNIREDKIVKATVVTN